MEPINESYKWHIDSSKETYISTKETCKRDIYKRHVRETYLYMTHIFVKRDIYSTKKTCKRNIYKRHVKEIPLTEEIRLKIVGSPDFSGFPRKVFEWQGLHLLALKPSMKSWALPRKRVGYVTYHIKQLFTGVPQISNEFSREFTMSPSLKRSIRETDRSDTPVKSRETPVKTCWKFWKS